MDTTPIQNIDQKIQELELELIDVQTRIRNARPKAIDDFIHLSGYASPGTMSISELQTKEQSLITQIRYLEQEKGELLALTKGKPFTGKKPGYVTIQERVNAALKKYPKKTKADIIKKVAEDMNKSSDATRRLYYHKGKGRKPSTPEKS